MTDNELELAISEEINPLLTTKKSFNAYDITEGIRKRFSNRTVDHSKVYLKLNDWFSSGLFGTDYHRRLANLQGVLPQHQPWQFEPKPTPTVKTSSGEKTITFAVKEWYKPEKTLFSQVVALLVP